MAQLNQETVPFSLLAKRVAEDAYKGLKEVCEAGADQSDTERKIALLKYIHKTRQRLLRLYVICKWCRQIPLVERCQQLLGTLGNHDMSFTQAADSLFYLHDSLQQSRAPMYDVPSAIEVLLTGSFHRLPKCIEDLALQPVLEGEKKQAVVQKLDTLLRSKLLDIPIPREFSSVTVHDGRLRLRVDGEFEVELTLGYRGNSSLWRILDIQLLVGERSGTVKFTDMQRHALGDDLERRMAVLESPFGIIFTVLHEFCVSLVMDTLVRQVRALRHGRWKDAIRLDHLNDTPVQPQGDGDADGLKSRILGLKITYWLDMPKSSGAEVPSLRIEPGTDQRITCQHFPPLVDPCAENEAEFLLDQSCIDVEQLLLKAINCNIHSRLQEVKRSLTDNANFYKGEGDLFMKHYGVPLIDSSVDNQNMAGMVEDCLYVRAYSDLYMCLGISIRNGRFILRAQDLLPASLLQEMEDALNQGTMSVTDVFTNLRMKSITSHFASMATSMCLKVYEPGSIIPKGTTFKQGSSVLFLGFPNTDMFFLAVQVDQSFMPAFVLLEAERESNTVGLGSKYLLVRRQLTVSIDKPLLPGDEANLSLLGGTLKNSREALPKTNNLKPGSRAGNAGGHWQRSPAPAPPASLGSSPSRAALGSQPGSFQNRKSSSASNLLSLVPQSPAKNPINRMSPSAKLADMDYVRSRSPLRHADNPGSPDVDDDNLSKLIESISASETLPPTGARQVNPGRMVRSASKSTMATQKASPQQIASPTRKRKADSDVLDLPSLQQAKKRLVTFGEQVAVASSPLESFAGQSYAVLTQASIQGKAPRVSQMAVLLHVVNKCKLEITHLRLERQLDAQNVSYLKPGITSPKSIIFRLAPPRFNGGMKKFCEVWRNGLRLRYGGQGSDGWEVTLNDEHYKTLWNLQQRKSTEWGSGVQYAALSEVDAHIKCCEQGLMLSYSTVEDGSIKRLVADLNRLRSARAFALCMKSLLETRTDGFKVEGVGLTSVSFSYTGSMQGVFARFVIEWAQGQQGCSVHVSPEQLWPHTKYLEQPVDGGDVELLIDTIRLTAGPLHALAGAIRPARMSTPVSTGQAASPQTTPPRAAGTLPNASAITSRGPGPGIVPSSLLPTDICVLADSSFRFKILYRKKFMVQMICCEGDQVYLQPVPPVNDEDDSHSLPCPQFRPFVVENVALGLNSPDSGVGGSNAQQNVTSGTSSRSNTGGRPTTPNGNAGSGFPLSRGGIVSGGPGVYPGYKGELNSAFNGMSDEGGYGGAWAPLAALKKVLRSTLKFLGVLWLFHQFPTIIKEVLGSIMPGIRDGGLLHHDPEQPALRFNIGNCMFAVNMHRHQLYLQGVNVRRFQPPQTQAQALGVDADLTTAEMTEIAEFFGRRVACEPYDASRLASFITMLTLPVAVLREFLSLIAWKKDAQKNQSSENTPKPRIELCLENRPKVREEVGGVKSSILHDRERGFVEFALTAVLDLAYVPQVNVNVAGGAGWLPQCVSVRMKYSYSEGSGRLVMVNMEGSHGGKACWGRDDEWEKLKEKTAKALETAAAAGQEPNGRLRLVAEAIQSTVQSALQQLRAV